VGGEEVGDEEGDWDDWEEDYFDGEGGPVARELRRMLDEVEG
jgi:hypothetical protein